MDYAVFPAGVPASNGLVHVPVRMSVSHASEALLAEVKRRGLKVFAQIDFSGDAASVGLTMRDAKMLIFGNPRGGTPVMVSSPSAAIDLPLKVLVWQDANGDAWLTYNSPEYLRLRHDIPATLIANISGVVNIVATTAENEAAA